MKTPWQREQMTLSGYLKFYPKFEFIFKWFDMWIGVFWDSKKKWLYILPLPMIGIIIKFNNGYSDVNGNPKKP